MKKTINIYLVAAFLFSLPLLLANTFYIDDNGRAITGNALWGRDGRPLADLLMKALFLSSHVSDIFPLPLIITTVLIAVTLAHYHRRHFSALKTWVGVLATLSFFANPYLAEIVSYRFDVLTIGCALVLSLAWVLFPVQKPVIQFLTAVFVLLAIYCLYQIAVNIAVMMVFVAAFGQMVNNVPPLQIIRGLVQRGAAFLVASVIYLKILLPRTFSGEHAANHPGIADNQLWETICNNALAYWHFIDATFYKDGKGMEVLLTVLAVAMISAAIIALRYVQHQRSPLRILVAALALLLPCAAFLIIPGSLLILQNPLLAPRVMLAVSGFMLFSATLLAWAMKGKGAFINVIVAVPLLYAFTGIYVYGNAIRQQDEINAGITHQLKQDTNALSVGTLYMQFNGAAPRSPVYLNSLNNYPVLSALIPEYFANWWFPFPYMAIRGFKATNPIQDDITVSENDLVMAMCHGERIARNQDYDLYQYRDRLTVDFTRKGCQR
ncbi:glucosyltransferase domain-containing protein [Pantoea allii]|uniref:glucosyltransferase domain-containing protein n=1 Tax=Pantoea allii TaxID=574096 RepID=UPI001F4E57FB|nr:glucosyltransferase domain-containing protein [Pantoea allii]MCH9299600.1 glucosyltransferase domain-containing protein [Pantoea allii]